MFITDKNELSKYSPDTRIWQGIPGIEVTKNKKIFLTLYSGEKGERIGNYSVLACSYDGGKTFTDPIAVAYKKECRCFDPCLWIDPLGRLWWFWCLQPESRTYFVRCDNPDAEELIWSDVQYLGHGVMMNKPTVLSSGEWLFPLAVWQSSCFGIWDRLYPLRNEGAFVYKSLDKGETFVKLGCAQTPKEHANCDEHMITELNDGRLMMLIRTSYGIGVSYSYDGGKNWSEVLNSNIPSPVSRFFIRRLSSGRILMINHHDFNNRNNLTALLSEDEGKTWKYKLLLDSRNDIAYPDAVERNGFIHITYDRERGDDLKSLDDVYNSAREILYAKITEEDIIAGELLTEESRLQQIASKLGKLRDGIVSPYKDLKFYTPEEATEFLCEKYEKDAIIQKIFELYPLRCMNLHRLDNEKLDEIINEFNASEEIDEQKIFDIISIIQNSKEGENRSSPIINRVKEMIDKDLTVELSVRDIAEKVGISYSYMSYLFKKNTGLTIVEYRNQRRISLSKKLLINSAKSITEISQECGFSSSSYFSECFNKSENMSPKEYRRYFYSKD